LSPKRGDIRWYPKVAAHVSHRASTHQTETSISTTRRKPIFMLGGAEGAWAVRLDELDEDILEVAALGNDLAHRPFLQHAPLRHDRDRVAHELDLTEQVAVEKDRDAALLEALDQRAHVAPAQRVEVGGGLVEDQELRPAED